MSKGVATSQTELGRGQWRVSQSCRRGGVLGKVVGKRKRLRNEDDEAEEVQEIAEREVGGPANNADNATAGLQRWVLPRAAAIEPVASPGEASGAPSQQRSSHRLCHVLKARSAPPRGVHGPLRQARPPVTPHFLPRR